MKEITLRLADPIAESVKAEAEMIGLTSEELLKYVIGRYAADRMPRPGFQVFQFPHQLLGSPTGSLDQITLQITKSALRAQAQAGALKCKNCTMELTPEDVDNNSCHTCQAPIIAESTPPRTDG